MAGRNGRNFAQAGTNFEILAAQAPSLHAAGRLIDKKVWMKTIFSLVVLLCGLPLLSLQAQPAVPPSTTAYAPLSAQQLDQLLGPIALYPDPLMGQILPAATLPTQIVTADRYIAGGGDPNQIEQQPWDPSVQGLAHYPAVLKWMDDNLTWTTQLGEAFLNQQQDVMASVQRLRAQAQNLGNLQSTPQQQVVDDSGDIEILPADPDEIYVPQYSPDTVYVDSGFATPFVTFGIGFPIGIWLNGDFDWHNHRLVQWDRDHPRPAGWWHERPGDRDAAFGHQGTVWRPDARQNVGLANRGDRGWGNGVASHPAPARPQLPYDGGHNDTVRDVTPHFNPPQNEAPREAPRENPVEAPARPAPVYNRPASSTFIGIQNANDARNFSSRGQESRQIQAPAPRPSAPAEHFAPASGGGGSHGGRNR